MSDESRRKAKDLFDRWFTPERKQEMAMAYLSLFDVEDVPRLIAPTVLKWLEGAAEADENTSAHNVA